MNTYCEQSQCSPPTHLVGMAPKTDFRTRFWAKVDKSGPVPECDQELGPCWLWTGAIHKNTGYGICAPAKDRTMGVHVLAWELCVGDVFPGLSIDHLCRIKSCVNPRHLEPVTQAENVRRGTAGEASTARSKAQTRCKRGHEFTEANTYMKTAGHAQRSCRACNSQSQRRLQARLAAKHYGGSNE